MGKTPDSIVWIIEETLSDGSLVYNVQLPAEAIPAITSEDATDLAQKVVDAINEHSNNTAGALEQ